MGKTAGLLLMFRDDWSGYSYRSTVNGFRWSYYRLMAPTALGRLQVIRTPRLNEVRRLFRSWNLIVSATIFTFRFSAVRLSILNSLGNHVDSLGSAIAVGC
jgi:hypothetical protein